jgi:hypothetical protein
MVVRQDKFKYFIISKYKWHFEKPNVELWKTHLSASSRTCKLYIQISNVHICVVPGPASQDAVFKSVYALPGLQCSVKSPNAIELSVLPSAGNYIVTRSHETAPLENDEVAVFTWRRGNSGVMYWISRRREEGPTCACQHVVSLTRPGAVLPLSIFLGGNYLHRLG